MERRDESVRCNVGESGSGLDDDHDDDTWVRRERSSDSPANGMQDVDRKKKRLLIAILSQILSVLLTFASISVQSLANDNVNLPATLNMYSYALLCVVYVPWLMWNLLRDRDAETSKKSSLNLLLNDGNSSLQSVEGVVEAKIWMKGPLWKYCVLALCDVEANFIIVFAYNFTSITSVTLLDFSTIPFAMILTYFFLQTRYNVGHIAGATSCVAGLLVLVLADVTSGGTVEAGSRPYLGDSMVVFSAFLYASSNMFEENILKTGADRKEVLAALPLLALPLASMQAFFLEHKRWQQLFVNWRIVGWATGYVTSIFTFYSIAPYVLREGGSAAFNLAMITSDLWAGLAKVLMFGGFGSVKLALAFFVALILVMIGLFVFTKAGDPVQSGDMISKQTKLSYSTLSNNNEEIDGIDINTSRHESDRAALLRSSHSLS